MNRQQKLEIIKSTKGKVFTANFVKKNGDLRSMNCRLGVTKHLKGGDNTTAHIPEYVTVFDMQKKAYRNLNLDTLMSVRTGNAEIRFN